MQSQQEEKGLSLRLHESTLGRKLEEFCEIQADERASERKLALSHSAAGSIIIRGKKGEKRKWKTFPPTFITAFISPPGFHFRAAAETFSRFSVQRPRAP